MRSSNLLFSRRRSLLGGVIGFVVFLSASKATAAPVVQLKAPVAGATVLNTVDVKANVTDSYAITSVTAALEGSTQALTLSSGFYVAQLNATPYPFGPVTLTVAATNVLGESTSASVVLTHALYL